MVSAGLDAMNRYYRNVPPQDEWLDVGAASLWEIDDYLSGKRKQPDPKCVCACSLPPHFVRSRVRPGLEPTISRRRMRK